MRRKMCHYKHSLKCTTNRTLLPEINKIVLHLEEKNKGFSVTKAMKDKKCVTIMVCFAEDGNIFSLYVVGKSKKPKDGIPPLTYTS